MTATARGEMGRASKMPVFDADLINLLPNYLYLDSKIKVCDPDQVGHLSFMPTEKCGVVVGSLDRGCYFIELENTARNKFHNYEISPEAILRLQEAGIEFSGLWHSHPPLPNGVPVAPVGTDMSSGPWPSSIDLDYHPLYLNMYVVYLGVIRQFNVEGELLDQWATVHEAG